MRAWDRELMSPCPMSTISVCGRAIPARGQHGHAYVRHPGEFHAHAHARYSRHGRGDDHAHGDVDEHARGHGDERVSGRHAYGHVHARDDAGVHGHANAYVCLPWMSPFIMKFIDIVRCIKIFLKTCYCQQGATYIFISCNSPPFHGKCATQDIIIPDIL